jgi:P-type Ca2+ transporter type 2C
MSAPLNNIQWHALSPARAAAALATDAARGLEFTQAAERLKEYGPNQIARAHEISPWPIAFAQFRSAVVAILAAAAVISALLGERLDAAAIMAIVLLNGAIGFFQEYRAERAVAALAKLTAPRARVLRGGTAAIVPAEEVVPGDIMVLEAGDLVAADARLAEIAELRTNEAALTGESEPVEKNLADLDPDTLLPDRTNMLFLGTSVVGGGGRAIVVATGSATEFGRIARMLESASDAQTPLQRQLDRVGHRLLWACLGIVVLVFALGWLRSRPIFELFLGAVGLAVAAIPEGLPAIVTVGLALGVSRMAARHALVRRLHSVETLGCAGVICTDKTGTLTVGQMTARRVTSASGTWSVSGEGYAREGGIFGSDGRDCAGDSVLLAIARAAVACNSAQIIERNGRIAIAGDPTEGALLVLALKAGIETDAIQKQMPVVRTIAFSSDRKRMSVLRRDGARLRAFVKGAPEAILPRCSRVLTAAGTAELTAAERERMAVAAAMMASEALRIIACAERFLEPGEDAAALAPGAVETGLTLLGLVGLQDPPRAEALEAVRRCTRAGIRTVMITGDHPETGRAVASEVEILRRGDRVMTGADLERMPEEELRRRAPATSVFARVTAEHKLRIVRAWKSLGAVVAMTGDGVNDAPALKEASIGVAMGIAGTEVTRQAADIVLADDNFASIVAAVEEGRGVYDNIVKTLAYLMSGNAGELLVMLVAALVGWPLPLLPTQLLWINLVTDGLPALALATDPVDPDVLARPPREPSAGIMDRDFIVRAVLIGCMTAAVALTAFGLELHATGSAAAARSAGFFVLVTEELLRSFGSRSMERSMFEASTLSNLRLLAIVAGSFALQLAITQSQTLQPIFGTQSLSLTECVEGLMLAALPLLVLESVKFARRMRRRASGPSQWPAG